MTTKENKSWYYIDDNGVRQGPFKPSRLQKWVNRGLFKPSLQLTQNPTDPNSYVSLLDLTRSSADPNQIFSHVERVDERGFVLPLPLPILPPPPLPDSTRELRSQILQAQFEISLVHLHRDALHTVATSLEEENTNLQELDIEQQLKLLIHLTKLNQPTDC